jgi:hypothetical protein
MRNRVALALALLALLICMFPSSAYAQDEAPDSSATEASEESPSAEAEEDAPGDDDAEEGAEEGEEAATPEAGPPWTYQMARMTIGLTALMLLAIGMAYYRFVVRRQRGEV